MNASLLLGGLGALLLFWAVGAYNRLVRLRADVNAAFASLASELDAQLAALMAGRDDDGRAPASADNADNADNADEVDEVDEAGVGEAALRAAAGQLSAALFAARPRPLEPGRIAALNAAWAAFEAVRGAVGGRRDADGGRLEAAIEAAALQCNRAISQYNAAIAAFPAVLLAWVFGFKRGDTLHRSDP